MTTSTTAVQGDDLVPGHGDLSYGVSHYDLDLTYRHVGNHLAGTATLECVVEDDTGALSLVFLGRSEIPGIAIGTRLRAEGTAGEHHGRLAILNPVYQLRPRR